LGPTRRRAEPLRFAFFSQHDQLGRNGMKTQNILNGNAAGGAVREAWRRHHERLLQLREQVAGDAGDLAKESGETVTPFSMHPADAASDSFDRDLAYSLLSLEQNALAEIDAALQRIRDGTYGVCEITGELIPRQRLEAIPWARCTVEAQAELEKLGGTAHVHLNPAESVRATHNSV
jgi:RNA polymerase-binding transcription factor DksA